MLYYFQEAHMRSLVAVFILISCLALPACAIPEPEPGAYNPNPRTYYVDRNHASASDSNAGTESAPWKTLDKAAHSAIAGDTVLIKSGTYAEKLFPRHSGNSLQYITFRNYPGHSVTLAGSPDHGVYLSGVLYIRIQGLIIRNEPRSGIIIQNHFSTGTSGPSDYNIIISNTVHHNGNGSEDGHGIYIGGHGNQVVHNRFYNNGSLSSSVPTHGIYLLGNDNQVISNQSLSNAWQGIRSEGEDNEIAWNTLSYNQGKGLSIWADAPLTAKRFQIHHNLLVDNKETGIGINGGGGGIPDSIDVYNNTIINNSTATYGISLFNGCRNVHIRNNIISGSYTNGALFIQASCATGLSTTYNLFYGTEATYYLGTVYNSLTELSNAIASPYELGADPLLDSDYIPLSGSPARNSGLDLGYAYRGSAPDRGFAEFAE